MKKTLQEFKDFIAQGNILDMAIGFVMGTAFKAIVTSLVDNIIMPFVGVLLGGVNFAELDFTFRKATISYGIFIQNIIDFMIIAICLFVVVKTVAILGRKRKEREAAEAAAAEAAAAAEKSAEAALLEEIRDLMKKEVAGK